MTDTVEVVGNSLIQHGRNSQRVYLMKSDLANLPGLIDQLEELATENSYSKIFAKIPASQQKFFLDRNYKVEATVPGLYNGVERGLFLGKYPQPEREQESHPELVKKVLTAARGKQDLISAKGKTSSRCQPLLAEDMEEAAALYQKVFESYPFPIHDPDYLRSTMDHISYYGVRHEGKMVALSSAEVDFKNGNAEMTDFATHPEHRGRGYANLLLARMEADMKEKRIPALFTIARAYSYGMNITFAKNGYLFSGTLTNNTQISGQLESMNVWYKLLPVERNDVE